MNDSPARALVAEAIGTFALCFVGILAAFSSRGDLTVVALAHGLIIFVMVAALSAHSGGHFNPAVTLGFVATGRMSPLRGAGYVLAQIVGAVLGSAAVSWPFRLELVELGSPALVKDVTFGTGLVMEIVATFFLVLVIFGTAVDSRAPKAVYPAAIGLTITACIMAIGPITGAALNPARAFGPSVVTWIWDDHVLYWIGPVLGGVLAAWLQHGFLLRGAPSPAVATRGGPAPSEERGNP
ncbi:MAG TPA: aquaporin [Longimicrobium sp.]|nr:aquaporin [Longimicrobium sp.]